MVDEEEQPIDYAETQNGATTSMRDLWTKEDQWLYRITNASSKHALVQVHERMQGNATERKTLMNALTKPYWASRNFDKGECTAVCA